MRLGNAGALNSTTPDALNFDASSTGKLQLAGNSVAVGSLNTNATVGTPIIENGLAATTATLTDNTSGTDTYAGVLQNGAAGTLALAMAGSGKLNLTGANTYTGGTTISNGILNINADGALGGTSGTLTFAGNSTLQAGANNISLSGTRGITLNPGVTGTIDTQSNAMTINGLIGGNGALTKAGAGTLTITGVNSTYSGGTTLSQGAIAMGNINQLGRIDQRPDLRQRQYSQRRHPYGYRRQRQLYHRRHHRYRQRQRHQQPQPGHTRW